MRNILNFFMIRLERRLMLFILPLVIIPVVLLGLMLTARWTEEIHNNIAELKTIHVENEIHTISDYLEFAATDIELLSKEQSIDDLGRALLTTGEQYTPEVNSAIQAVIKDLSNIATTRGLYDKLRFINSSGLEVIRLDYDDASGEITEVAGEAKGDRPYFVETIKLQAGELYVSPLDLDRTGTPPQIRGSMEDDTILPTIRYATPIEVEHPDTGRVETVGVIVLSVNARPMLDLIEPSTGTELNLNFLIDQNGYYLRHSQNRLLEFGFEPDIDTVGGVLDANIQSQLANTFYLNPDEAQAVTSVTSGVTTLSTNYNNVKYRIDYATITPPGADYHWTLLEIVDEASLFANLQQTQLAAVGVIGLLLIIATTGVIFIARQISQPLLQLTNAAQDMSSGNLAIRSVAGQGRNDEIGLLNSSFNIMAEQLESIVIGLEDRIAARTKDIETSAEIAAAANEVREIEELLSLAVNLIRDRFNFYYVQVYLLDSQGEWAILEDGTGYLGRRLLVQNHRLSMSGTSLVSQAIKTKQIIVVQDVSQDPNFLPNAILTDTRSEIVIPLHTQSNIIGALDIQHNVVDAFPAESQNLFRALAEQLAITFENVRLYEDTQRSARELQTVAQVSAEASANLDVKNLLWNISKLTRDNFGLYHAHIYLYDEDTNALVLAAGAGEAGRIMVEAGHSIPMDREHSLVARAARSRKGVISNDVSNEPDFLPSKYLPETKSEMAIPIINNQQLIGVLDVQASVLNDFDEQDIRVKSTLADQIGVAVTNARTFEDVERARQETERLYNSSVDMLGSANFEGYFVSLNPAWETTLGYTRKELLAAPFADFIHPDDVEATNAEAAKIAQGITAFQFENRYRHKDGHYLWVSWNASADLENGLIHFVTRDITEQKLSFEEIQNAKQETERIFNSSVDMLGSANFEGYFVSLNPAWETILGYTREELLTTPFIDFVHPDDVESTNAEAAQISRGITTFQFENRYRRKDGDYLWFSWNTSADLENGLIHFVTRDITEQKYAEDQIQKRANELETVARVSSATTTILDVTELLKSVADLTKSSFNLYHAHIYLLNHDTQMLKLIAGAGEVGELMMEQGVTIPILHENSIVARAARSQSGVIANNVHGAEGYLPNPLLPDTKSEMAIPMMVGTELIGVLDIQSTILDRFTDEDIRIMTTLAGQVAIAVTNAMAFERERKTVEQLKEIDRLKQQFLANMSHELRTPLNSIIGYSEVLLDGVDGDLTDDAHEDVEAIHNSGKHLLSIINEILDLAKIDAGQMELDIRDMNAGEFLSEIVKSGQILVKDKNVKLKLIADTDVRDISGDKVRLRQIMWNLVSNAVKFTEEGNVTVHYGMYDNNFAYVRVEDTGIGMTRGDLDLIFERFRQVDGSSTRRAGGTGLGLTITKQLVEMHGGEIFVESELNVGSTFWFTIPMVTEESMQGVAGD